MHHHCLRLRAVLRWALLSIAFAGLARATTVVAPSFSDLVAKAETIVRARVVDVRCVWADSPQGRVIKTHVTFEVQKPLKGAAPTTLTLQFLGGELDGAGLRVEGMPQFAVGGTEILFISGNGVRFCPLVAMMHGRYRVLTDPATAREYVARNDGVPLTSEHDVQLPQTNSVVASRLKSASAALSPAVFEQRIQVELTRHALVP